jgi:NDP-sugar pyrophosphorylase family protein
MYGRAKDVITLEIAPDVMGQSNGSMLDMNSQPVDDDWEKTIVQTAPSGELMGWAKQARNPRHLVRFFQGKGGFCVVVTSDDLVYFGLPGSRIQLPDTEVELPGEPITGKPERLVYPNTQTPAQTVSHQAMILGAGLATRFEPVSGDTTGYPKPGVPLAGELSVIAAIARLLGKHGFSRILVNTYYKPQRLKEQLNALDGLEIIYIDEDTPSGTAGGLVKALRQGLVDRTKPIIIIQGDAVTDADLSFLMQVHRERRAAVTIGGQIVPDEDVHKFGIIETDGSGLDGQSGNITSFKEKPSLAEAGSSRFGNSGFYILAPKVYDLFLSVGGTLLDTGRLYDYAKDFFPAVLEATGKGRLVDSETGQSMGFWAQAVGGYWSDIGNPTQYVEALRDVYAGKLQIDMPRNIADYYADGIVYWPGAKAQTVEEGARLSGNVIVARR